MSLTGNKDPNPFAARHWRVSKNNPSNRWVKFKGEFYTIGYHPPSGRWWVRLPNGKLLPKTFAMFETARATLEIRMRKAVQSYFDKREAAEIRAAATLMLDGAHTAKEVAWLESQS